MNIEFKVPNKSIEIEIHPFNNNEYLIKQTFYGHQININKKTLDVLNLVDGVKSIKDIATILKINPENIYDLLYNKLGKYGIIKVENIKVRQRGKSDYLKLSITLLKKDLIEPIAKFLSPIFSKTIFYPILLMNMIVVFGVLFFNFDDLIIALKNLRLFEWLIYIMFSGIVLFSHEFGHASSCYKYGAIFGDIGFGFYLFTPVMFADVSDIWRLKSNERIIVNFSGIYIELILGSIFSILFLIFNNLQFLVLSSIISFSVFTNLNPFLRYDGYWILSDLINVPNLRKESNKKMISLFKKKLVRKTNYPKDVLLVIYGLISNLMILFVVITIIIYDPNGLVYFPRELYNYILKIFKDSSIFMFSDIYKFILPFIFYYIVFKFLALLIIKLLNKFWYLPKTER